MRFRDVTEDDRGGVQAGGGISRISSLDLTWAGNYSGRNGTSAETIYLIDIKKKGAK